MKIFEHYNLESHNDVFLNLQNIYNYIRLSISNVVWNSMYILENKEMCIMF